MKKAELKKVAELIGRDVKDLIEEMNYHADGDYWDVAHWVITHEICPDDAETFGDGLKGTKIETLDECLETIKWHQDDENIEDALNQ